MDCRRRTVNCRELADVRYACIDRTASDWGGRLKKNRLYFYVPNEKLTKKHRTDANLTRAAGPFGSDRMCSFCLSHA